MNNVFDGDCLNILYLINKEYIARSERVFNPRNEMYISKNDGMFNNDINHCKDILVTMNSFINLSREAYSQEDIMAIKNCLKQ